MTDRVNPSVRSDYIAFQQHSTRWWDNDSYRHVNNAVYYSFFDSAVNQILIEAGVLNIDTSPVIGLVVETNCRYYAPIAFPDTIHTGVRVSKIGTSSVHYEIGLFRNDSDHASADGFFVHVYVDRMTNKPQPIPDDTRKLLETLRAGR
ncbi:acyl-CoA thioesterase [Sphingomonas populi]|uniref:Acyl-CoA thioesterase n=1 Tax=Sphingomonas populi TaxID=2484750 RepID=A0A4Q6Y0C1_9SPHN|nr:thioesterase family protein [Sphingomonas populi]RZF63612.1 acyl-CoA thioesterase [Sphingomonas populi]